MLALLVGLLFGFFGSMPIAGPTAVVLVSKGLDNQIRAGMHIAAGAAAAESGYVFMAFLGLTSVLSRFPVLLPASRLLGCLLLIGLGLYFALRKGTEIEKKDPSSPRVGFKNVLFGLSLTAVNPTLLMTWTAAVGAAHSTGLLRLHPLDAFPFAAGAALGMLSWSFLLMWMLAHFRSRLQARTLDRLIRVMGVLLVVLGSLLAVRDIIRWNAPEPASRASRVARAMASAGAQRVS